MTITTLDFYVCDPCDNVDVTSDDLGGAICMDCGEEMVLATFDRRMPEPDPMAKPKRAWTVKETFISDAVKKAVDHPEEWAVPPGNYRDETTEDAIQRLRSAHDIGTALVDDLAASVAEFADEPGLDE